MKTQLQHERKAYRSKRWKVSCSLSKHQGFVLLGTRFSVWLGFCLILLRKNHFQMVWLINFSSWPQTRLKQLEKQLHILIILYDCCLHKNYSQGLPCLNQKQLEKCSLQKHQLYQPVRAKSLGFGWCTTQKSQHKNHSS